MGIALLAFLLFIMIVCTVFAMLTLDEEDGVATTILSCMVIGVAIIIIICCTTDHDLIKATKADKIDWDQYTIIEEKEGDKTTKVIFKDKETGKEYEMKVE